MGEYSKKAIMEWRERVGVVEALRISGQAASRGTALHTVCEKYLLNDPDYLKKALPSTVSLFNQIKHHLDDNIGVVRGIETPLTSDYLKIGGRIDCAAEWKGRNSIVDFKSSTKIKPAEWIKSYFMQTAIYAVMFEERTGIPVPQLVIVMAAEESNYGKIFIRKRDDYIKDAMELIRDYYVKKDLSEVLR